MNAIAMATNAPLTMVIIHMVFFSSFSAIEVLALPSLPLQERAQVLFPNGFI